MVEYDHKTCTLPRKSCTDYDLSTDTYDTAGTDVMDGDCDIPSLMEIAQSMEDYYGSSDDETTDIEHHQPDTRCREENDVRYHKEDAPESIARPLHPECCCETPRKDASSTAITIKGLPPDHPRFYCMGNYKQQRRTMNGRSVYIGGRDNDMALWFNGEGVWVMDVQEEIGVNVFTMYVHDSAVTPDRITAPWMVDQGKQPSPSVRVRKFKHRETILELSGLPREHCAAECIGRYIRQARTHDGRYTYKGGHGGEKAIWFVKDVGAWCVGDEKEEAALCLIFAVDSAPTPTTVQSMWRVQTLPEVDPRVQVCGLESPL
jgi:hypothetical protein